MTMMAPAIDHEGSGALQYFKPDLFTAKEIRLVMPEWKKYVALANTMTVSNTFIITLPSDLKTQEFEARKNLHAIRSEVRAMTPAAPSSAAVINDAQNALRRLQERANEPIDMWAERLARDASSHRD